jgi:hypothetical protein
VRLISWLITRLNRVLSTVVVASSFPSYTALVQLLVRYVVSAFISDKSAYSCPYPSPDFSSFATSAERNNPAGPTVLVRRRSLVSFSKSRLTESCQHVVFAKPGSFCSLMRLRADCAVRIDVKRPKRPVARELARPLTLVKHHGDRNCTPPPISSCGFMNTDAKSKLRANCAPLCLCMPSFSREADCKHWKSTTESALDDQRIIWGTVIAGLKSSRQKGKIFAADTVLVGTAVRACVPETLLNQFHNNDFYDLSTSGCG